MTSKFGIKAILAGFMLATTLTTGALAQELKLKLGHLANEQNSWHKASLKFGEELSALTDGRIVVEVFPNDSLGREIDLINGMQLGTVEMTITGESLQNWAPKAAMMAVPYAFRDAEHLRQAVESEIGEQIEAQITERANLVPLAWFERGPRELTSNRPIRHPDDLDGIRLRVPNVPLFVSTWEALGARPTPMAFSEVFTALQQNTIQAQENPLSLIESASFNEVQDYVNLTGHVRSWIYVVIGRNRLESMPEELQQIVREAAQEMQVYQAELFEEDQQRLEQALQERGMEFVEVDTEAFAEKARPAVEAALNDEQRELFDAIQNL